MENEIVFSEKQKFKQWWLWLILIAINGLLIFGLLRQVVGGKQFGDKPMSNTGLILITVLMAALVLFFIMLRLETVIKNDGIYVRFYPFHIKFKYYNWTILRKSFVRDYSAIGEFGGWGLRYGFLGRGSAFNVSGEKGLQLEFTNNKKLLIGTNKPQQLTDALQKIGQLKP